MYETILVGTDGSETAQRALEHAVDLARAIDATLHVITVVDTKPNPMKFGVSEVAELSRAKRELAREIEEIAGDSKPRAEIRRGDGPDALLEYASEIDADLLIVGKSDVGQLEAAVFGRTTDRLARNTQIPLTIVPAPEAE